MPPLLIVESLDRVSTSTDGIDEVNRKCDEDQTDEKLNNRILNNLHILLRVSVNNMRQIFQAFLAFFGKLGRFSLDEHLNYRI